LVIVSSFLLAVRVAIPAYKQWLCQWLISGIFYFGRAEKLVPVTNSDMSGW